ncbi:sulfotransferase [Parasphingopyxis marina]|uniref:Sulfotransferase n=1 Tax=Parasphingopyxis marina TaxID=2761622 RepID=A0A842HY48_9SPHN|nr:sulfotransferase [Parasphingopyxis marina]MBC2777271.1 sulfotransferase [Parasphingopyxis marina]
MASTSHNDLERSPVAIGGLGGSGTRVVAQLFRDAGFYIGADINRMNDNLWAVLLFNWTHILEVSDQEFQEISALFFQRMRGEIPSPDSATARSVARLARRAHDQFEPGWLEARAATFMNPQFPGSGSRRWGWKCPPIHTVVDRLLGWDTELLYVHVVRHGLDMAYSSNKNQLNYWGAAVLGRDIAQTPSDALAYWCRVERQVRLVADRYPDRVFILDFDRFCDDPAKWGGRLLRYCGLPDADAAAAGFANQVKPLASRGRFRRFGIESFDSKEMEFVASCGYAVT